MGAEYSFRIDQRRNLVYIELHGRFSLTDVAQFDEARHEAYARLRCGPNEHVTLVDMRGTAIQSSESLDAFARSLGDRRTQSRRIAFVVPHSLARMQVERVARPRHAAFFATTCEARDWLLSERPGVAP